MVRYLLGMVLACAFSLSAQEMVEVGYVAGAPAGADWDRAPGRALVPANPDTAYGAGIVRRVGMDRKVFEPTTVKLLWNSEFLFVRFDAADSDIVAQSKQDQAYLYVQGDAVEIFLKPENAPYYWELYGDVSNRKTCIFIPSRGLLGLPDNRTGKPDLELAVETRCDGTLNRPSDRDKSWSMTVKIPADGLSRYGTDFKPGEKWTFCVVRYNYSRYLPMWERTVYPGLSGEPHLYEEFAELKLLPPER